MGMTEEQRHHLAEHGFCVILSVISGEVLDLARAGVARGVEMSAAEMGTRHIAQLDPNPSNLRANNLVAADPVFLELLRHPLALEAVRATIGDHFLVSNFTANVALPGSGSMNLHSDQALVIPAPWLQAWTVNVIWCLDDVHDANGATRYVPGSHRFRTMADVPSDAMERTVAFSAPAGSIVVMDGRLWHTSGCNVTANEQRRMAFAYYSADFIRQQANWPETLLPDVRASLDDEMRALLGLTPAGNMRIGSELTRLDPQAA